MIKIVICDDDDFTIKLLNELLEKTIQISKIKAQIVCKASSGTDVINFVQKNPDSYLYFLDFDFGKRELNGIDLSKKIYQYDPDGKIVFVTSHEEKGMTILQSGIQAFGFIEKDPNQQTMIASFTKYLKMAKPVSSQNVETSMLELPIGIDETICLPVSDIAYVDSVKTIAHSICYHTFDDSEITMRDTIEHALELLGKDFVRCHRSIIINKHHIIAVKGNLVKLTNGITLPLSLSKRAEVLAAYHAKE